MSDDVFTYQVIGGETYECRAPECPQGFEDFAEAAARDYSERFPQSWPFGEKKRIRVDAGTVTGVGTVAKYFVAAFESSEAEDWPECDRCGKYHDPAITCEEEALGAAEWAEER